MTSWQPGPELVVEDENGVMRDVWSGTRDTDRRPDGVLSTTPSVLVGARVHLDRVVELVRSLGYDPDDVVSLNIDADCVTVVESVRVAGRLTWRTVEHAVARPETARLLTLVERRTHWRVQS